MSSHMITFPILIIDCTRDCDCPINAPYCIDGICIGNTEYRKYRCTTTLDTRYHYVYTKKNDSVRI